MNHNSFWRASNKPSKHNCYMDDPYIKMFLRPNIRKWNVNVLFEIFLKNQIPPNPGTEYLSPSKKSTKYMHMVYIEFVDWYIHMYLSYRILIFKNYHVDLSALYHIHVLYPYRCFLTTRWAQTWDPIHKLTTTSFKLWGLRNCLTLQNLTFPDVQPSMRRPQEFRRGSQFTRLLMHYQIQARQRFGELYWHCLTVHFLQPTRINRKSLYSNKYEHKLHLSKPNLGNNLTTKCSNRQQPSNMQIDLRSLIVNHNSLRHWRYWVYQIFT